MLRYRYEFLLSHNFANLYLCSTCCQSNSRCLGTYIFFYLAIILPTFTDVLHVANVIQDAQVHIYIFLLSHNFANLYWCSTCCQSNSRCSGTYIYFYLAIILPTFSYILHVANLTKDAQVHNIYFYLAIVLPTFTYVILVANLTQDA